jgi:hypothetical protein
MVTVVAPRGSDVELVTSQTVGMARCSSDVNFLFRGSFVDTGFFATACISVPAHYPPRYTHEVTGSVNQTSCLTEHQEHLRG